MNPDDEVRVPSTFSVCLLLLLTFIFLYLQLFILPHTPIWGDGDASSFLASGQRIAETQVIYRDFFSDQQVGTSLVYAAMIKVFGLRSWIPNVSMLLLGTGLVALSVYVSTHLIDGLTAFLPGLLYLCLALKSWLDPTHHWYSAILVLAGIAVLIEKQTIIRVATAGLLCGLAASFTLAHGAMALAGFALYLAWDHSTWKDRKGLLRAEGYLIAGFGVGWTSVNGWAIYAAGPRAFFYCNVLFLIRYFTSYPMNSFSRLFWLNPPWPNLDVSSLCRWTIIGILVPWTYVWFFFYLRRQTNESKPGDERPLVLLSILGFAEFIAVLPSAGFERVVVISFPVFILFVYMIRDQRYWIWRGATWIVVVFLLIAWSAKSQFRPRRLVEMRSGVVASIPSTSVELYRWLLRNTRVREPIFDVFDDQVYFWLDLKNPTGMLLATASDFTRPEQIKEIIDELERYQVRIVLWNSLIYAPDYCQPAHDHTAPLVEYLCDHYQIVKVEGEEAVLERATVLDPTANSKCLSKLRPRV